MKVQKRRWLNRLLLSLVLLAAVGGIVWGICGRVPDLETYQAEIERAMNGQEYEQALRLCSQALKAYPEVGSLYEQKAEIYYAQGEIDLAVRILDYGYKQTGLVRLLELRNTYDDTDEPDVVFHPARVASPEQLEEGLTGQGDTAEDTGNNTQAEEAQDETPEGNLEEVYRPYELPQVSLPHVDPPEPDSGEETSEASSETNN